MSQNKIPAAPLTEQALIRSLMCDEGAIDEVEGLVTPAMLFDAEHRGIFDAILRVRKSKREINIISMLEALAASGEDGLVTRLLEITNTLPNHGLEDITTELRAVHQRREYIRACMELAARGHDPSVAHMDFAADVESRIAAIASANVAKGEGLRKLDPQAAYDAIMETIRRRGMVNMSTTLTDLDSLTSGLSEGHVMVIGGLPGSGKTGLAIQMIEECALNRHRPAAFFSLEMPEADIAKRIFSRRSGVRLASMRSGHIMAHDVEAMNPVRDELAPAPIFIFDQAAPTIGTIRAETRRLLARVGPLGLVIVDYLQLARGVTKTDSREQEVAEVSRGLKALAKEVGAPVVALAQLNADGAKRANQRPRASDLRESKAIWQDADTVVLIHNPSLDKVEGGAHDDGDRELILGKNRHGACGVVKCRFDKNTATFMNEAPTITPWPKTTRGGE
jgi:replicative DNA helicase